MHAPVAPGYDVGHLVSEREQAKEAELSRPGPCRGLSHQAPAAAVAGTTSIVAAAASGRAPGSAHLDLAGDRGAGPRPRAAGGLATGQLWVFVGILKTAAGACVTRLPLFLR